MLKSILKSTALAGLLALTAVPAAAQVQFRAEIPIPSLQIRVGHHPPPPMRYERVVRSPGRSFVWIAGYWHWNGYDWDWVPGRWERSPYRRARWVAPRYIRESYGVRYEPGHWSHQRLYEGDEYRRYRYRDRDRDRDRDRYRDRDRDYDPDYDDDRNRDRRDR